MEFINRSADFLQASKYEKGFGMFLKNKNPIWLMQVHFWGPASPIISFCMCNLTQNSIDQKPIARNLLNSWYTPLTIPLGYWKTCSFCPIPKYAKILYSKTPQSAAPRSADPANLGLVFCSKSPQSAYKPRKSADFVTEYLHFRHIFHLYTINLAFCGFRNLRFFPGPKIRRFRGFIVSPFQRCYSIKRN